MNGTFKEARQRSGVTVQQIAEKARVSRGTINNAENGNVVRVEYAQRIIHALNELAGTSYTLDDFQFNVR